ncbi:branched-chain amino acid ABC transporter permease [Chelativorans xinjiangense]|uniref:branched-chain amino acid ABC transporter permease n=1 Tax=Chelativorans xinjiangense TaxID=2681485 RepID=UPI001358B587|nr:branched-chain amino acid ABC transporter permease [Chelativorans xinjiangense]
MTDFLIYLATMVGIWGILSLSLNLQYGVTGLVNLGHIVFFMLGAYISTIMVVLAGWPIFLGMAAGVVAAAAFGALMALPTSNLQQDYWAISTLAAAEIVRLVFLNTQLGGPYSGAAFGMSGIPRPLRAYFTSGSYDLFYMVMVLTVLAICLALCWWVLATPFGRTIKALREGDHVPLALGKRIATFRIRSMALGGGIGGLAGALFAHYNAFISPQYFLPLETFIVWAMVILGGAGNFVGVIVGTVIIQSIYNSTRFLKDFVPIDQALLGSLRMILIAVLIILVILYMPKGLIPERRRRYERPPAAQG